MVNQNRHGGPLVDDFLHEDWILDHVRAFAIEDSLTFQLQHDPPNTSAEKEFD